MLIEFKKNTRPKNRTVIDIKRWKDTDTYNKVLTNVNVTMAALKTLRLSDSVNVNEKWSLMKNAILQNSEN